MKMKTISYYVGGFLLAILVFLFAGILLLQCTIFQESFMISAIEKSNFVALSQFSLKEVIRQTIFSIADNDSNKLMTGELFEINGSELKVVSLDGHRISIRKIQRRSASGKTSWISPGT